MDNIDEHELRLQYLHVLMGNGVPLIEADVYFTELMSRDAKKESDQKDAINRALELTALSEHKKRVKKTEPVDFSPEEKISAQAFVAGEKFKNGIRKENTESKKPKESTEASENVIRELRKFDKKLESSVSDFLSAVEVANSAPVQQKLKLTPEDVMSSPGVPVKETDKASMVEPKPTIPMVDPKQNSLKEERPKDGIQESTQDTMGRPDETPMRYEDRVKYAQQNGNQ